MNWWMLIIRFCCLLIFAYCGSAAAEQTQMLLSHNPFNRPAILAIDKDSTANSGQAEESGPKLELTATLVSNAMPLVIAGGELLTIGEEISGYRLIAVDEGRATFTRNGKAYVLWLVGSGVQVDQ